VRFEAGGNLRHGRVARLVFSETDEAAATGDLEGSPGLVDRVGDVHEGSLSDSLGAVANSARALRRVLPSGGDITPDDSGRDLPSRNVLLLERFRDLETLPKDDQSVAMKLLDALIAARSVETAVARARRTA
jgi:hypothetical protein